MGEGGTSCLLLVEGPSGTGKSHLLSAVAAEARQRGSGPPRPMLSRFPPCYGSGWGSVPLRHPSWSASMICTSRGESSTSSHWCPSRRCPTPEWRSARCPKTRCGNSPPTCSALRPPPRSRRSARWPSPSGSPPGCCCRWWRRPPMSGSSPASATGRSHPTAVLAGRPGVAARTDADGGPRRVRTPRRARPPRRGRHGRPALADQPGGDRPGDRHPGQRRPHQQPDRTTRINRPPRTVSYHLRKMFGTLSVRSRSELAGTVRPRLREAP
jgi:hypothetical protein